jgi:hypothetical protein
MTKKANSYVQARIRFLEGVETSDDPDQFHTGPDYDVYIVEVVSGPQSAFLQWFEQDNEWDLCRVGDTSEFLDLGGGEVPQDGELIDFTFDEFFPRWLDVSVRLAQAEILSMSRDALAAIKRT